MPFQKGKSGNPLGLSSGEVKLKQTIRKLAGKYAAQAIETLREMLNCDENSVRISAANALLDRSVGKAAQAVDVQGDITISVNLKK